MKKILTWGLCVVMLISVFSVCAFAEDGETPAGWSAFGDITINYDSELASQIKFDGQFDDWTAAGIQPNPIDAFNMDAWNGTTVPDDFEITTYFGADAEYLYIAFNISDTTKVSKPADDTTYDYGAADAFQIQLDFGKAFAAEADEALFDRGVFYSFARRDDGQLIINVDELKYDDRVQYVANETDEESGKVYVKGSCTELASGWGAELALSWQMLYEHAYKKLAFFGMTSENLKFEIGPEAEFTVGALVAYLNYDNVANEDGTTTPTLIMAAATAKEYGSMNLQYGFYPENTGINLIIRSEEDADINIDTKEDLTEPPTEEPTEAPTGEEDDTPEAPDDDETTEAPTTAGTTGETDAPEESGCKSVAGIGAIAIVSALGTAVVIKKRK